MAARQPNQPPVSKNGPYPPQVWQLGGTPSVGIDIPITAVFLVLYMLGAATHMSIFQLNKRRGKRFLFSAMLFGFCMARIVTTTLRIASTAKPHNVNLALASSIFVAAGVVLIYVINLVFAQRLLRAHHPRLGWHRLPSLLLKLVYVLIVLSLAALVTSVVQSFFTLSRRTRSIDRAVQLYGATFNLVVALLPVVLVALSLALPRRQRPDKFGHGRFRTKIAVLLAASLLIGLGAAFRCVTAWLHPVPRTRPLPAYFSRACFYVFNFGVEVLVVYLYALVRVDKRFWVPNGARGPGSYGAGAGAGVKDVGDGSGEEDGGEVKKEMSRADSFFHTEEETFGFDGDGDMDLEGMLRDVEAKMRDEERRKMEDADSAVRVSLS